MIDSDDLRILTQAIIGIVFVIILLVVTAIGIGVAVAAGAEVYQAIRS